MKYDTNNSSPWMCQYDWKKAIESLSPQERYLMCCQLIGKDKTDAFLEDLAKHPFKRRLWKLKWKLKKGILYHGE